MNLLMYYRECLYNILLGESVSDDETLIKMHTRYLEELGDMSFPIPMKNWYHLSGKGASSEEETIFHYKMQQSEVAIALQALSKLAKELNVNIITSKVIKTSAHLFLERSPLFQAGIKDALALQSSYGQQRVFCKHVRLILSDRDSQSLSDKDKLDLTTLRLCIVKETIENMLGLTASVDSSDIAEITISQNNNKSNILCGPVVNEQGVKDTNHKAIDLFHKRITDMRLMAQHRYRVNMKSATDWNDLLARLGTASVTIELLSNKPHKAVKVTLNDPSSANKGPAFIFYNCARLSILLEEFENKVIQGIYPKMPEVDQIDFTLLKQPEEWELLYVYILQYPHVIKSCIRDIEKRNVNPQHLISFLSSLSSVFSVYYRRVRILTDARDHMFKLIHSRISLLRGLQVVFHNALQLLNIKPIKEM